MGSDRIPEECEHTECTHEPRHVLTIETEDGLAEEWVCFRHRRRRLQSEDVRPGPKSRYAIADGGQSSTVSAQIELQLSDVKRLENHEAVAFGDIEIAMSGAAARYLHADGGLRADGGTEQGKYGDTRILPEELDDSFREIGEDGDVKAKVWRSDDGDRRLYLRVRDHDDGRKFNEFSFDLNRSVGTGTSHSRGDE